MHNFHKNNTVLLHIILAWVKTLVLVQLYNSGCSLKRQLKIMFASTSSVFSPYQNNQHFITNNSQ